MRRIDVFGDGKSIYDADKLPDEIVNEDGKWKRENGSGVGYSLVEYSPEYLEKLALETEKVKAQRKEEKKAEKIQEKLREIAERELEEEVS